jgi:hypothetical protein
VAQHYIHQYNVVRGILPESCQMQCNAIGLDRVNIAVCSIEAHRSLEYLRRRHDMQHNRKIVSLNNWLNVS